MKIQTGDTPFSVSTEKAKCLSSFNRSVREVDVKHSLSIKAKKRPFKYGEYYCCYENLATMIYPFSLKRDALKKLGEDEKLLFSTIGWLAEEKQQGTNFYYRGSSLPVYSFLESMKLPGMGDFVRFVGLYNNEKSCSRGGGSNVRFARTLTFYEKNIEKHYLANKNNFDLVMSPSLKRELSEQGIYFGKNSDHVFSISFWCSDIFSGLKFTEPFHFFENFRGSLKDVPVISGDYKALKDCPFAAIAYLMSLLRCILEEYRNVSLIYANDVFTHNKVGFKNYKKEWVEDNLYYRLFLERLSFLTKPIEIVEVGEGIKVPVNSIVNPDGIFMAFSVFNDINVHKIFTGSNLIYNFYEEEPLNKEVLVACVNSFKSVFSDWLMEGKEKLGFKEFFGYLDKSLEGFVKTLVHKFYSFVENKKGGKTAGEDILGISSPSGERKVYQSTVLSPMLEIVDNLSEYEVSIGDFARNYFA